MHEPPCQNLRGYAAAGLEASLHSLLTRARLTRVLTHCTWENTRVATSMPGSKIGCLVSGTDMSLEVEMATVVYVDRVKGQHIVARVRVSESWLSVVAFLGEAF
jgi:hypothetical protein